MTLRPIAPIGSHDAMVFLDGRCRLVSTPEYPPSPRGQALRSARQDRDWSQREFAARAGIKASELSSLESGSAEPEDPAEWERLMALCEVRP